MTTTITINTTAATTAITLSMNSNSHEKEDIEGRYGSLHTASSSPSSYTSPSDSLHPVAVATKENTILTKKFGTNILPPDMIRTRTVLAASMTFAVVAAVTICYLYSSSSISSSSTVSSLQFLRTVHKDDTCVPPSNIPFDVYGGYTGEYWDVDARQKRRVRSTEGPFERCFYSGYPNPWDDHDKCWTKSFYSTSWFSTGWWSCRPVGNNWYPVNTPNAPHCGPPCTQVETW